MINTTVEFVFHSLSNNILRNVSGCFDHLIAMNITFLGMTRQTQRQTHQGTSEAMLLSFVNLQGTGQAPSLYGVVHQLSLVGRHNLVLSWFSGQLQ